MGFAVAFPRGGSSSTVSRSNWNLEVLVFDERGKPEYPEKNLSEQSREPTTNSTHIWRRVRESNPGHIGGRRALSPLRQLCSPRWQIFSKMFQNTSNTSNLFYLRLCFYVIIGGLAQIIERPLCMRELRGSIPGFSRNNIIFLQKTKFRWTVIV